MKPVLDDMLMRLPGALGAAVVGLDGIPVEIATAGKGVNMEMAAAEGIGLARQTGWTPAGDNAASPEEIAVAGPSRLMVLRALGAGYFLCLVAGPSTSPGRARYEAWRTGLRLREVLG